MASCPRCGVRSPEGFRFCGACGGALQALPGEAREERKVVTVVFADLVGSTALGERLDPEPLREIVLWDYNLAVEVLTRHGGTVEKFIGDAVTAVFGIPDLHEDDALRAVRAAAELSPGLGTLNVELEATFGVRLALRIGVNTGEVVAGDRVRGQAVAFGDPVNLAARLEQAARPGEVLLGESTYKLVRQAVTVEPVEPLSLKGKSKPVTAYRLLAVSSDTHDHTRRLEGPMVGRDAEMRRLHEALSSSVRDRSCQLVTIIGPAGVGKSRLVHEFLKTAREVATVLRGRCLNYGEGISFWPVAEAVREAALITDADTAAQVRARLAALVGGGQQAGSVIEGLAGMLGLADASAPPEEIPWAVRKLFELLARRHPLVVVLDDLQWAEPALLDLLEQLVEWTSDAPIVLCCVARPELLEHRPGWASTSLGEVCTLRLEGLDEEHCSQLIRHLLGSVDGDAGVQAAVMQAAEGNPLFIEEFVAMLIEEKVLLLADNRWIASTDLAQLRIPPSISALLGARLDRLQREERAVIQRASVIGKVFYRGAVAYLSPEGTQPEVNTRLTSLTRKELIRPDRSDFAGEDTFRFRHLLVRDAAYATLPKRSRVDMHTRFASWLELVVGERLGEFEGIVGSHLERAYRAQIELGALGDRHAALGRRAAERLAAAGRRAVIQGDTSGAANLLERACALLPEEDHARLELLLLRAEAVFQAGEFARAGAVLAEVVEQATAAGDERVRARAKVLRLLLRIATNPEGAAEQVHAEAERLVRTFEALGDELGLAKTWRLLAQVDVMLLRWGSADHALERAVHHARLAGDPREESDNLAWLVVSSLWGPVPAAEGIRRCQEILGAAYVDRKLEATTLLALGVFNAMQERVDEARRLTARGEAIAEDLGPSVWLIVTMAQCIGYMETLAGDPERAERAERRGVELLERMQERTFMATTAALLAEAALAQGRHEEAERLIGASRAAGGSDDVDVQIRWRWTMALLSAQKGETGEAVRLASEAVAMASQTDFTDSHGRALTILADVLEQDGQVQSAASAAEAAIRIFERKGNLAWARGARTLLQRLST